MYKRLNIHVAGKSYVVYYKLIIHVSLSGGVADGMKEGVEEVSPREVLQLFLCNATSPLSKG